MAKLLQTLCVLLAFATLAHTQPYKGQKFVAGSFSVISQSNNTGDFAIAFQNHSIRFNPKIGLLISDKTAISLGMSFAYTENEQVLNGGRINLVTDNSYGIILSSRHFLPLGLGMGFYVQPNASYRWQHGENFFVSTSGQFIAGPFERVEIALDIQPGVYYFLSDRIALEASLGSLGLTHIEQDNNPGFSMNEVTTSNRFNFGVGTQLFLGISYFWGKKE